MSTAKVSNGTSILSGYAYVDKNQDGIRDAGDIGIYDAKITLTNATTSQVVATVYSGSSGFFSFTSVDAGTYTISMATPIDSAGTISTGAILDSTGVVVKSGLGTVTPTSIADITLGDGYTGKNYDFGELSYPIDAISKRSVLSSSDSVYVVNTTPVPEPSTFVLLIAAGLACGAMKIYRRRAT
jgi:hypothetical protein